jgi:hypothetical protein
MRPLQIYLDSSDISCMSLPGEQTTEQRYVQGYLESQQARGSIQLRFSEAHVIEAAPVTPDAIHLATSRLKTVKKLCGNHTLTHPVDLIEAELAAARSHGNRNPVDVLRDDGFWLPQSFTMSHLLRSPEDVLSAQLSGREQRRKYIRNGKLTPRGFHEFRNTLAQVGPGLAKNLPIGPAAAQTINQYYMGQIDRESALHILHSSLSDPEIFAGWYSKDWETAASYSAHLRELGKDLKECAAESRRAMEELVESGVTAGLDQKEIEKVVVGTFYDVLGKGSRNLVSEIAKDLIEGPLVIDTPWTSSPGLTTTATLTMHIARRSVAARQPRAAKNSDFGDAYHAIYLPYVDVFRADGFVASAIKESKLPLNTCVVDNFLELPATIDALLACAVAPVEGTPKQSA